jgi:TetR/AcrR family transcriptional regulator, transcriptional repressor for nem operon
VRRARDGDCGMRISKEQAEANHDRIVAVASELFRERGLDGVGVSDLMKAAGFTHGGFYNHFESKEALAAEAVAHAFRSAAGVRAGDVRGLASAYLSSSHRRALATGCPVAAFGSDAHRQRGGVQAAYADGLEQTIKALADMVGPEPDGGASARDRGINLLTRMVGALILARSAPDDNPLGDEILSAALAGFLRDVGAEAGST